MRWVCWLRVSIILSAILVILLSITHHNQSNAVFPRLEDANYLLARFGDLIFDIGVNTGQDTEAYLNAGYRVLAVEASPVLTTQLTKKFKFSIQNNRLTLLNVGISNVSNTVLPFYLNVHRSEWSSFLPAMGCRLRNGPGYVARAYQDLNMQLEIFAVYLYSVHCEREHAVSID
jgi:hypothetical protein